MNVLYVLGRYPTLSQTFVDLEIRTIIGLGHKVDILSCLPGEKTVAGQGDNPLHALYPPRPPLTMTFWRPPGPDFPAERPLRTRLFADSVAAWFAARKARNRYDIIHAHFADLPTSVALRISRRLKIPFCFTAHAGDIFVKPHTSTLREKVDMAGRVVTISHFNAGYLRCLVCRPKLGVTVIRACPNPSLMSVEKKEDDGLILSIGRLEEQKGHADLIRAMPRVIREVPQARLMIIGEGSEKKRLRELIRRLRLESSVTLTGNVSYEEKVECLRRATVFALPCVRARSGAMDGIPVALMEAMATRTAVVSTRLSGIPELVEDEREGALIAPGDIAALASRLITILEDPTTRHNLAENAQKKVKSAFNVKTEAKRLEGTWQAVLRHEDG